jgi:hypothetical protein
VKGGNFGWTAGVRAGFEDPYFGMPDGWRRTKLNARQYECLVAALAQHCFFARLRRALKTAGPNRPGWTMEWLYRRLEELEIPAAPPGLGGAPGKNSKLLVTTIRKAASGSCPLYPRDRALLETLLHERLLGLSAYGATVETRRVVREVLKALGVPTPARTPIGAPAPAPGPAGSRLPVRPIPRLARPGEQMVFDEEFMELWRRFPDITSLLRDEGRLAVRVDLGGGRGLKEVSPALFDMVSPLIGESLSLFRAPMLRYHRSTGEIGPRGRLPRTEYEIYQVGVTEFGQDVRGTVEGSIRPYPCEVEVRVPENWAERVGPRWGLLDGRFVFEITRWAKDRWSGEERPAVVRAMALAIDPDFSLINSETGELDPVEEYVELASCRFAVRWTRGGRAKLVSDRDVERDWGVVVY